MQIPKHATTTASVERPTSAGVNAPKFGSDVVAQTLRELRIPYIAINPGASFRGLHDSIVNFLGNTEPQMLLCLHEEAAVAIAHGYAKVTGNAMAVAVHSNVGLMHASMAMFNAFCDRVPVIVLGATGPVDAAKRRPWIDWIHTSRDQGALVRNFTKWDDQPASPEAAREAILRAAWVAGNTPKGPVYVNLDTELQEMQLPEQLPQIDASRMVPKVESTAQPDVLRKVADTLLEAKNPLVLIGRVSRDSHAWQRRVELVEAINARVATTLLSAAAFPTDHPAHFMPPLGFNPSALADAMSEADVILSLDWIDLGGTMKSLKGVPASKVVHVSMDHHVHNGWSMDYMTLPYADVLISAEVDSTVEGLIDAIGNRAKHAPPRQEASTTAISPAKGDVLQMQHLVSELRRAVGDRKTSLTRLTISWDGAWWPLRDPLDYMGADGGGGLGSGPGTAIGSALALKDSGRLPIAITGDGDYLMGVTALWTAVHYRIPILFVIANNRSFYNDELHQERVARMRERPTENKWIGQRISDPDPDIASLARAQGARGFGPVKDVSELMGVYEEAIALVEAGETVVVDVWIEPGYTPEMTSSMLSPKPNL